MRDHQVYHQTGSYAGTSNRHAQFSEKETHRAKSDYSSNQSDTSGAYQMEVLKLQRREEKEEKRRARVKVTEERERK